MTGRHETPMASYAEVFVSCEGWDLVHYSFSL
jgi:hypothetical protein